METKNKVIIALRVFIALGVWFVVYKGLNSLIDPVLTENFPEIVKMVTESMVVPYTLALGAVMIALIGVKPAKSNARDLSLTPLVFVVAFVIQSGISIPSMIPANILLRILGREETGIGIEEISAHPVFYVFLLLVFAPVLEEILFRKIFLDRLIPLGNIPAIAVSALLFALPHIYSQGIPQFFYTFVLGVVFAYIALRTKRIWPCMILHSLSNMYGAFLVILWPKDNIVTLLMFMGLYVIAMPLSAVLILAFNHKKIMRGIRS